MEFPRSPFCRSLLSLPLILAIPQLGCHDSGTKAENLVHHETTVSVHLVGDPSDDYKKVNLFITQVDVKAGSDWKPLAKPGRAVNLQNPSGQEEPLARQVRLERGDYDDLRLCVDPDRSSIELPDGSVKPLALPEPLKAGIPLRVTEGPATDNLVYDLILNIDAAGSVRRSESALGVSAYAFVPVARLNDRRSLGVMSGRLVDHQNQPLANVKVMAQSGEGDHGRTLVRTVRTGADGTYKLDLLPVRRMYYAVAQPRTAAGMYAAQASPGFRPTRLDRNKTFDFPPFQPAADGPGPEGSIKSPIARDQWDAVDLLQELPTGDRTGTFIVQAAQAVPGGGQRDYRFDRMPEGKYRIRLTRTTVSPEPGSPFSHFMAEQTLELKAGEPSRKVDF